MGEKGALLNLSGRGDLGMAAGAAYRSGEREHPQLAEEHMEAAPARLPPMPAVA